VLARGHKISDIAEVPCVVGNATEGLQKTKQAIAALKHIGAYTEVEKVKASRKLRAGKGKMRNRRHVQRLGPLVVYNEDKGITRAFRNLPGVDLAHVERLNLLQLAPGGHMGRFIVWTKGAFERLNDIYQHKHDYSLPQNIMNNSDLTRLINSDEIQSIVRPKNTKIVRAKLKKNPLKNLGVKVRLNPYALSLRRAELLHQKRVKDARTKKVKAARQSNKQQQANYQRLNADDFPADPAKTEEAAAEEPAKKEAEAAPAKPAAAAPAEEPKEVVAAKPKKAAADY